MARASRWRPRSPAELGSLEELGFRPRAMTRWLGPRGLTVTAAQVVISSVFGAYADRRELQAALKEPSVLDFSDREELWVDWTADTGDGFNPTYATASLLAREQLELQTGDGAVATRRGQLLVLGGDMVYPTPSPDELEDRFIGPYDAALPAVPAGQDPPTMVACAGNHDWYDGLTGFLRLFCNQRAIGAWQTRQTRSYFAVKLPHDWWLFAIDPAFDYFIDQPQLDFFRHTAAELARPGQRVILATHRPGWLGGHETVEKADLTRRSMTNLQQFEHDIIGHHGLRLELALGGDVHHYNRYVSDDGGRQRITCGAGGTFLHPTHTLAERFYWPEPAGPTEYSLQARYPSAKDSRKLRWGTLLAPLRNPSFVVFVGLLYLMFAQTIKFALGQGDPITLQEGLERYPPSRIGEELFANPASFLLVVFLTAALVLFADAHRFWQQLAIGLTHGLAHLVLMCTVIWATAQLLPLHVTLFRIEQGFLQFRLTVFGVLFLIVVAMVGGFLGAQLYAIYLFLMHALLGRHREHAFSCQRIEDWRSVLRMRLEGDGSLTLYPIGMRRVPRRWRRAERREPHEPRFEPTDQELAWHLIEEPIRLAPTRAATPPAPTAATEAEGRPAAASSRSPDS